MSREKYNRKEVYEYAKKWAYNRNPKYYNYDKLGGDCTNFSSQCILAGYKQMNYNLKNGWYYIDVNRKSPSWTGVEFLYQFLITNKNIGPKGKEVPIQELEIGDIIQLSFKENQFSHSLIIVQNGKDLANTLVAAHTFDTFGKKVSDYNYHQYRGIHILS